MTARPVVAPLDRPHAAPLLPRIRAPLREARYAGPLREARYADAASLA